MREALRGALRDLGLSLREEWLSACAAHLRATHAAFDALPLDRQARGARRARAHHALWRAGGALTRQRENISANATPLRRLSWSMQSSCSAT